MTADGGEFAAAAAEEEPAGGRKSSLSEPGALVLDPELDDSWSLQNQLFSRLAARNSQSASYPGLGFADRDSGGWRSAWRFSGELALGAGSSTWADRDLQEYFLREQRTTAHGNTFSFTQAYRVDRSWANSGTLILGARQELESFLWNGDLVLDEEYRSFKDKDMPVYDRRDSLLKLRFTPEWDAGRTRSRLDYKYSAHIYDQLSPYSYKLHQARFRLERDFSDKLFGEVSSELSRYRYTRPGVYSNNRHQLGTRLAWEATGDLTLTAAAKLEERDYPDRQLFSYQRDTAALSAELRPDDSSTLALGGETVRNERDAAPGDYRDTRYFAHYQRALSPGLDMSARYEDRRKRYPISPLDNLDQQTTRLALDAYPADAWNVRLDLARRVSDFALPLRSYTADESILSAAYYSGAWRCNASAGRLDQRYEVDGLRGFTRDSLRFDAACDLERTRLSAYYGGAWLDQDNPAARNGYVETCLGAACEIELDAGTMLRLCYDSSIRDYKNGYSLEDTLFEAKLAFDF